MQHKIIRIALVVLEAYIALTTAVGGVALVMGGIQYPIEWLQGTPFNDYTIPGLALSIIVGGCSLIATVTIFPKGEVGVLVSALAGLTMMGFEVAEAAIIDRYVGNLLSIAVALQAFYFILGLIVFGLAAYLWMVEDRAHHFQTRHLRHA
jgi:hypothetical protein